MIEWWDVERLTTPKNGMVAMVDHWFVTNDEGKIAVYAPGTARRPHYIPQGNSNKQVIEMLAAELYPGCTVTLLPVAYRWAPRD